MPYCFMSYCFMSYCSYCYVVYVVFLGKKLEFQLWREGTPFFFIKFQKTYTKNIYLVFNIESANVFL